MAVLFFCGKILLSNAVVGAKTNPILFLGKELPKTIKMALLILGIGLIFILVCFRFGDYQHAGTSVFIQV